jgi:hypothetical protein
MKILANPDEMHALVETLLTENVRLRADNERMARELGDFHMQEAARTPTPSFKLPGEPQCVACGLKRSQEPTVYARAAFGGEERCNDCAQKNKPVKP